MAASIRKRDIEMINGLSWEFNAPDTEGNLPL
jgi:hypothetical protein